MPPVVPILAGIGGALTGGAATGGAAARATALRTPPPWRYH